MFLFNTRNATHCSYSPSNTLLLWLCADVRDGCCAVGDQCQRESRSDRKERRLFVDSVGVASQLRNIIRSYVRTRTVWPRCADRSARTQPARRAGRLTEDEVLRVHQMERQGGRHLPQRGVQRRRCLDAVVLIWRVCAAHVELLTVSAQLCL